MGMKIEIDQRRRLRSVELVHSSKEEGVAKENDIAVIMLVNGKDFIIEFN